MAELSANYDTFRKRQIENMSDLNLPKRLRMGPMTSETARLIGSATGASPKKLDFGVKSIFAGMGKYGIDALDYALIRSGAVDIPKQPKKMLRELPLFRAFAQSPYAANKQVEEFYRGLNKAEETTAAFRQFGEHMGTKQQAKFFKENRMRLAFYQQKFGGKPMIVHLRSAQKALSDTNKAMLLTRKMKMSPEEKRDRLVSLAKRRNDMAEFAVTLLYPPDYKKIK